MKIQKWTWGLLAVVASMFFAVSCGGEEAAGPAAPVPTPNPSSQATLTALARLSEVGAPSPTPVPAQVRAVVVDFARGHDSIIQDWDEFHSDFDKWRDTLIACDPSSVQQLLRQFAARSRNVTLAARALPRRSMFKELSDKLLTPISQINLSGNIDKRRKSAANIRV